ncbi:MAG TPA: ABC transporter ATP-binding protein [Candidatus Limnocylindrales bacterium]|nr:ABC transporter ATP-binding protein [Candidatus Limnocylindrales bacterium]
MVKPAIVVDRLHIAIRGSGLEIVNDLSFAIAPGEVLGLVGESGSGKTTVGLALLGHARRGAEIVGGSVRIGDIDVLELDSAARTRLRGRVISYVPQDPASALNPALRIGTQLREVLEAHGFGKSGDERRARIAEMMREVALPDTARFLRNYPHELSGGQQQRIGLAIAFACRPRVIVLDEPTTGLDVTTQAHVLDTVRELASTHGVAALYVSHDLAVVGTLASRVAVMYAGRIIELGPASEMFSASSHPYTQRLIVAIPHLTGGRELVGIAGHAPSPGRRPPGCAFEPRCTFALPECREAMPALRSIGQVHDVRCVRAEDVLHHAPTRSGEVPHDADRRVVQPVLALQGVHAAYRRTTVLHDINFEIAPHECLALVGESGSGKTTLARSIAGLHSDRWGAITFQGTPLQKVARARPREVRRSIQYVFQNPYGSLNPRRTIRQIVSQPLEVFGSVKKGQIDERVAAMLQRVSLTAAYADRFPDQLSGGERQRVAIARALICDPSILICDEVTSALDVSVQAAIVELLHGLQRDLGLAMLFVTHNLPLVRSIAQRVAVMSRGRIVELGGVAQVLETPRDAYTLRLLADTPSLEAALETAAS